MRWITGGPDLPPRLLQSLEDGKLVFFCGAGISYPAGLPAFRGLVEAVYREINQPMEGLEQIEFKKQNYDRVLGLLEKRIAGTFVRRAVIRILDLPPQADVSSHQALVTLSTSRERVCRLVTTNFDRGFERVVPKVEIEAAPRLSVPKLGAWNCVIHLHGIINDRDRDGRSLVLTSADFGAAYLTERWASRFISDLFRRFTVLFVGYSVEDPVIRYMMDAFAADRAFGEGVGPAYVMAGTENLAIKGASDPWEAKGVIPLLYDDGDNHSALHLTLRRWADAHRTGLLGKESIVRGFGSAKRPTKPFADDPEVSQLIWAISEPSGHTAQVFSKLNPVPPIEWLEAFATEGLLTGVNVSAGKHHWAPLVDSGTRTKNADRLQPVARALCQWLSRHLENASLLEWIFSLGSSLHPDFQVEIARQLDQWTTLSQGLRPIWEALTADPQIVWTESRRYYDLVERLSGAEPWNISLKNQLLGALAPRIVLGPSSLRRFYPDRVTVGDKVADFAEAEVVIAWRDHAAFLVTKVRESSLKDAVLSSLPDDLTSLLKRTMEAFETVQKANAVEDLSYIDQPSISRHPQNSGYRDWTALIELLRDSWQVSLQVDRETARRVVERWRTLPYPVFRRLCFFAMAESDLYSPSESLECFLEKDGWWLWSPRISRETYRMLQAIGSRLSDEETIRLTSAILSGPPRSMFREDITEGHYREIAERGVWLRLAKLEHWGCKLTEQALSVLRDLSSEHPVWQLAEDGRDEFPVWTEGTYGEPPIPDEDEFLTATNEVVIKQLVAFEHGDDIVSRKWRRVVAQQPARAFKLIATTAEAPSWSSDLWEPILQGLKNTELNLPEWARFLETASSAPEALYGKLARQFAWLLHGVTSSLPSELDGFFWTIWDRVLPFAFDEDGYEGQGLAEDPITRAINLTSGILTGALLDRLANARPHAVADISNEAWSRLTEIADGKTRNHAYARAIMATRLAWFYHLDSSWCEAHLRKYFDWAKSDEAATVWKGFLWQANLTPELWLSIKPDFLIALSRKASLGNFKSQISTLFGFVCIDKPDWLLAQEVRDALRATDPEGRADVSQIVFRRLQGAGDRSGDMWSTHIGPWFELNWPKDSCFLEPGSAFNLAMAAAYAGDEFSAAVNAVRPFLVPYRHYAPLIAHLLETDYPERFSEAVLMLLDVLDTTEIWVSGNVRDLARRLETASPEIRNNQKFVRLDDYLRVHNL